ncbi:hypothetical protein DFP72DRAFT_1014734 [Ephemerocybe angulata]|uniref:DUF6589 domain-containing protein n=1 Tax=Ephemerocybe angulata TaxID=980116 RepID=A0A8H6LYV5_9AGAR|nr:hypothetical protein DFP72DRAFT_1014734 [Tulosesus angulatus]
MLQALEDCHWKLSHFLHAISDHTTRGGRGARHAQVMSAFLQGRGTYTPIEIIDLWVRSPDSRIAKNTNHAELMYSFSTPYKAIRPLRPAITSLAVQMTEVKLASEAKKARRPVETVSLYSLQRIAQLTLSLQVVINALSTLNFTRNNEARLLPLMKGLLYFAHSAPVDLISYNSRTGDMPAYTTIYKAVKHLGKQESAATLARGRDPKVVGVIQFDNVQNYTKQRDHRVGRVNHMNIGMAGTFYELEDVNVEALSLESKQELVAKNTRATVTVNTLLGAIDTKHLETVFVLHWLRVLSHYIPQLHAMRSEVSERFRTRAAKIRMDPKPNTIHPLSTSGKNETITTELNDGLMDFLAQIGQQENDYLKRLILVGGDGLTYQKLLELRKYKQFHEDPLESLEIVEPVLSLWHTEWTNLSNIYETHFDSLMSRDPSTLGHSTSQIGRPAPPNLKKVDYNPATELLHLVVDVRMLDCWRNEFNTVDIFEHFETLERTKKLPKLEELEATALKLHRAFSTTSAIYQAAGDTTIDSKWTQSVPKGSPWPRDATAAPPAKKEKTKGLPDDQMHQNGDRCLANSINLIRDGLYSTELTYAIAEGDVGRVHEILKVLLFTFAGSGHSKYTSYLLEFICSLEHESTADLRELILRSTLVNLTGRAGAFSAADLMQEYFNRLLEAIVDKKGAEYGDDFIRSVISPNLHHFARIKIEMRAGVGLSKHSGRHSEPHMKPEIKILLDVYHKHELHKRRAGRVYNDVNKDNFNKGAVKLQGGRLKNWISETTSNRDLLRKARTAWKEVASTLEQTELSDDEDYGDSLFTVDPADEHIPSTQTELAFPEIVDGRMVLQVETAEDLEADMDDEDGLGAPIEIDSEDEL